MARWTNRLLNLFQNEVFPVESEADFFNQYRDCNPQLDIDGADTVRQENLRNYIKSYSRKPTVLIVGESPGPWDCRFSGIPITGERQLLEQTVPFAGKRTSTDTISIQAQKNPPFISNSAVIFWRIMTPYFPQFFIWNSVPFHTHKKDEALSVRNPRDSEVKRFGFIVQQVVEILQPERVIALGRKAESSLQRAGVGCDYVRHPSQGGAPDFERRMNKLFREIS